ncbi:hypothetical protein Tco_0757716 [Tanacetum coccineum]
MSTAEAKYVSLSACCAQVIWMRTQLLNYRYKYNRIPMYCDSKVTIAIHATQVQHSKYKNITSVPFIKNIEKWKDGSKYRLTFMLDKKELSLTLDDFKTIFHLPQANANNHDSFMPPPSFLDMVPFYKKQLGFTMELKTSSSFKTTSILHPWQTLCGATMGRTSLFSHHPTSSIPYLRFTKIIISHYMTSFPEISRRARDKYHNLKDDDIMKNIFNSGRYKDKVRMKIPDWIISEEMNHTEHYQMYAEMFGLDVPLTQSQPTESTQGTHRHLRPVHLNPKLMNDFQDAIKVSLAEHKSREEQEARENMELVNKHLASVRGLGVIRESPGGWDYYDIEEEEITDEVYELKKREKGKIVEESRSTPFPTPIRSPRIHTNLELQGVMDMCFEQSESKVSVSRNVFLILADHLQEVMVKSLPTMVDTHIKEQVKKPVPEQVRDQVPVYVAEGLILERQKTKE